MRIVLYARVSTAKQAEKDLSIPINCDKCAIGAKPMVIL